MLDLFSGFFEGDFGGSGRGLRASIFDTLLLSRETVSFLLLKVIPDELYSESIMTTDCATSLLAEHIICNFSDSLLQVLNFLCVASSLPRCMCCVFVVDAVSHVHRNHNKHVSRKPSMRQLHKCSAAAI